MVRRRMLMIVGAILLIAVLWVWRLASNRNDGATVVEPVAGVTIQYLLTPDRCGALGDSFSPEFDVMPDSGVVVANASGLLLLHVGPDGTEADRLAATAPDSFALDGRGAVLSIIGPYFGQLEDNEYSRAVPLPYDGMRLAGSSIPGAAYLFGGHARYGNMEPPNRVYGFYSDGTLQIEAEIPDPVVAVADNSQAIYLATAHEILRVSEKDIHLVMRLPEQLGEITSIATQSDDKALYFATGKETFVVSGMSAVSVLRNLGGIIRMRNGNLYVWSPTRKIMVGVGGLQSWLEQQQRGT